METIPFARQGGPLHVEIRSGWANPGAYDFILWEADSNAQVMTQAGNFLNSADDRYQLPGAAAAQHGRIAEAFVTITPVDELGRYFAALLVSQDGHVIGEVSASGESTQHSVTLDLFARLEAVG